MRKIMAGFLLAIIIGIPAIYFGLPAWANRRAQEQVDAAFVSLQAQMGKAHRGAVSYDIWTHTLKIADVTITSDDPAAVTLKFGQMIAKGATSPSPDRMEADSIELTDFQIEGLQLVGGAPRTTYRAPKITIGNYSGPTTLQQPATATAGAETMLALLEAMAKTKAAEISVPTLSVTVMQPQPNGTSASNVAEYGLTDLRMRYVSDGRVGATTVERMIITGSVPDIGPYAAEMEKFAAADVDMTAMIPLLDTAQRKDDNYRTIYRSATSGPYRLSFNKTASIRIDATLIEGFGLRPSAFADPAILALGIGPGLQNRMSPADASALAAKIAAIYSGVRVDKLELRGFAADVAPVTTSKASAIRLTGLENGRVAEIALEGVDAQFTTNEPVKIGRVAIKGVDLARIARQSINLPGAAPSLTLLAMFNGFEIDDVKVPQRFSTSPAQIESLSASWDKFVGLIPSQIRVSSKFITAIDPATADPGMRYFSNEGKRQLSVSIDLGVAWNETTQTLLFSPVSANAPGLYDTTASLTLNNVPRALFSPNAGTMAREAAQLEIGRIEASVHDLGGLDVIFHEVAKQQQTTVEAARKSAAETAHSLAAANPDFQALAVAVARLLEMPGSTLKVGLTPRKQLLLGDAVELGRNVPIALLSQFNVEASAGE